MPRRLWQRLCCFKCNHYVGRYKTNTASTIEQQLYCRQCKGHTEFCVANGELTAARFIPKEEQTCLSPLLETSVPT